jgi:hypothetical protein
MSNWHVVLEEEEIKFEFDSSENIINMSWQEEHPFQNELNFLKKYILNKRYNLLERLSLREFKAYIGNENTLELEKFFKFLDQIRPKLKANLLKKSTSLDYTYPKNDFLTLGANEQLEEIKKATAYYARAFYQENPVDIEIIDWDELVLVIRVSLFPDIEHVLANLRLFLAETFKVEEINVIPEI